MSEIVTWSVKIDEETKQEIQQLLNNSDQQGKDFVQSLVTAYKINKVKESNPESKADIEELQYHTARVNEIYFNLTSRVASNIKNITQQHTEKLDAMQLEIDKLREEKGKLKEEINTINLAKQAMEQVEQDQLEKIKDLESSRTVLIDLNHQYKDKIEAQNSLENEYKQYKEDMINVQKELTQQETQSKQFEAQLRESEAQLRQSQDKVATLVFNSKELQSKLDIDMKQIQDRHKEDVKQLQDRNKEDVKQLQDRNKEDVQIWKDKLNLESAKEAVKKQQEYQEQLQMIRDEYNEKVKDLLLLMQQTQQVQDITPVVVPTP